MRTKGDKDMKTSAFWMGLAGALIIAAIIGGYAFLAGNPAGAAVMAARVDRDCGPADGPAFTLTIPVEGTPGSMILISIWQSPDFKLPVAFSFPYETGQAGNAVYRPASGPDEELSGEVSFPRVSMDDPVKGQFSLTSEGGQVFSGGFEAEWGAKTIPCG
jgi:hypothetical protein